MECKKGHGDLVPNRYGRAHCPTCLEEYRAKKLKCPKGHELGKTAAGHAYCPTCKREQNQRLYEKCYPAEQRERRGPNLPMLAKSSAQSTDDQAKLLAQSPRDQFWARVDECERFESEWGRCREVEARMWSERMKAEVESEGGRQ